MRSKNPRSHPEYQKYMAMMVLGREEPPVERYIKEAWIKVFKPDNPYYLPQAMKAYDPSKLPDTSNIGLKQSFSTMCPGYKNGTGWAKGKAKAAVTSLVAHNLSKVERKGDPIFSNRDNSFVLTMKIKQLALKGTCTIKQNCCTGMFGKCFSSKTSKSSQKFTLTQNDVDLIFSTMAVFNPAQPTKPPSISVLNTQLKVNGKEKLKFEGSLPSWLDWMKYLSDAWMRDMQFKQATTYAMDQVLRSDAVRNTLQSIMNKELAAIWK